MTDATPTEFLVFYAGDSDESRTVGYASMSGEGLDDAFKELLDICAGYECEGSIDIERFGRSYQRSCASIRPDWEDDGDWQGGFRLFDVAGRSHKLMIGDRSLADILADAVSAYNEEHGND